MDACRSLESAGLNHGASGNVSLRVGSKMLISPTAVAYSDLTPDMVSLIDLGLDTGQALEGKAPSSEWRIHKDILTARPNINAIVHTHAPFCTILANARKPIPAIHYMIAAFGGTTIPVADYATFGTPELSQAVIKGLGDMNGVLMANHGALVAADNLERAIWLAQELETLAHAYVHGLAIGAPHILSDAEVNAAQAKFATYGLGQKTETKI